jgi:hypothetical protein
MSSPTRIRTDFKTAIDHIKDRVLSNVTEGRQQGRYKIEDQELRRLMLVIEASFEQGFITASGQIEKTINEFVKEWQ